MTDNLEQLIKEAVEKALEGDMDAINNIEDRVTRSKAKAALVKAKREAAKEKPEVSSDESDSTQDSAKIKTSNENIAELIYVQKDISRFILRIGWQLQSIYVMTRLAYLIHYNV